MKLDKENLLLLFILFESEILYILVLLEARGSVRKFSGKEAQPILFKRKSFPSVPFLGKYCSPIYWGYAIYQNGKKSNFFPLISFRLCTKLNIHFKDIPLVCHITPNHIDIATKTINFKHRNEAMVIRLYSSTVKVSYWVSSKFSSVSHRRFSLSICLLLLLIYLSTSGKTIVTCL